MVAHPGERPAAAPPRHRGDPLNPWLIAFLGAQLLVAGAAGWHLARTERAEAEVNVLWTYDPLGVGTVTEMEVHLRNVGETPIEPVFRVPANPLMNWYAWETDGPERLDAGESANYVLRQPPRTGVPLGDRFRVLVTDRVSETLVGTSALTDARTAERAAVLNPGFASWLPSMLEPHPMPYGWLALHRLTAGDEYRIDGTESHARVSLRPTPAATEPSVVTLRQRVDFPRTLTVDFAGDAPGGFVGITLEDVAEGRRVVIVPATSPGGADLLPPVPDQRVVIVEGRTTLDFLALWTEAGWRPPAQSTLPRLERAGASDVGMGDAAVSVLQARMEVLRPLELRLVVLAPPGGDAGAVFRHVGGPSLDQEAAP